MIRSNLWAREKRALSDAMIMTDEVEIRRPIVDGKARIYCGNPQGLCSLSDERFLQVVSNSPINMRILAASSDLTVSWDKKLSHVLRCF